MLINANNAYIDPRKLTEYCLNPANEVGKHKAKVFASALGLSIEDADELRRAILVAASEKEARPGRADQYGSRYTVDFEMERAGRYATVRSCWIIRVGEDFPRLTSCYVL